jgi:hypothetical protein
VLRAFFSFLFFTFRDVYSGVFGLGLGTFDAKNLGFASVNSFSVKYPASLHRTRSPSWQKAPRHLIGLRGQGLLRAAGMDWQNVRRRRATARAGRQEAKRRIPEIPPRSVAALPPVLRPVI